GVRYLSRHCSARYEMIGELLNKEEYDIALLQEVGRRKKPLDLFTWLEFVEGSLISEIVSGVIGSGLAVFSRHKIHDTFLYRYSLNGYPYMAHHGDWFGGKAVGMVILNICGMTIHVYVTHLHAEYSREKDAYLPHRVVQAWELLQFIRHTSSHAEVVILGGDLNTHPQDLGSRLLCSYTGLRDSYIEAKTFDGCEEGMTLIPQNPFVNKKEMVPFEKGIRIDYILFKGSPRVHVKCESLTTTKGSVPGKSFPYSDHEALSAVLLLQKTEEAPGEPDRCSEVTDVMGALVDMMTEARTEVKVGLHCAERMRYSTARVGFMGLVLLLLELAIALVPWLTLSMEHPFPRASFYLLGALCFTTLLISLLMYIFYTTEVKALQGAEDQMRLAMGGLQECLQGRPLFHPDVPRRVSDSPGS
ncbi:NSMA phosphodiesterase, partial [Atractosteus spatula]|nr:NSMA phosphodiesterase [Atractosteus spatula]